MEPRSVVSNVISLPAVPSTQDRLYGLLYFIPGNPGLIEYYDEFLGILRDAFDSSQTSLAVDIYGKSLAGFHDYDHEPFTKTNPPFDLETQICLTYADISSRRVGEDPPPGGKTLDRRGTPYDCIILMGHSVGAYMALE